MPKIVKMRFIKPTPAVESNETASLKPARENTLGAK